MDAELKIEIEKTNKIQFPTRTLVNNLKITSFAVPVFPPLGIIIFGTISFSLKADLVLNVDLEKEINFRLAYSKHVTFTLPFGYRKNVGFNYPNPSNVINIHGTNDFNPDFSQFRQIPKFGADFTLTPGLTIKWPDFSIGKKAKVSPVPEFLKLTTKNKIAIKSKRGALDDIKKFLQLVLTNELPIVVTAGLTACTGKCRGTRPIDASLQISIASYQGVLSGLGLSKKFQIPLQLTSPAFSLCIPFFDICPNNIKEIILTTPARSSCTGLCQNEGK